MSSRSWGMVFLQKAIYLDSMYLIPFWEGFPWVRVTVQRVVAIQCIRKQLSASAEDEMDQIKGR